MGAVSGIMKGCRPKSRIKENMYGCIRERSDLRILAALRELRSNAAMRSFYSWWCNPLHVGLLDRVYWTV